MITISFHYIVIRMQRVCYARGSYNCNTNCDLKVFKFPSNPRRYDVVIIDIHDRTELYFTVHKQLSCELNIYTRSILYKPCTRMLRTLYSNNHIVYFQDSSLT